MSNGIKVLGAGLVCVDIVHDGTSTRIMNGGSCANVISVLAQIGYDCRVIREQYDDPMESFLSNTLSTLGVKQIYYKQSRASTPRVIEQVVASKHCFYTICPSCGKKILALKLPASEDIVSLSEEITDVDVFYCDRTSSGIKELIGTVNTHGGIVFYEPNSVRNMNSVLETVKKSDIVKFSKDRVPTGIAERIRREGDRVKLIISTEGAQGAKFSYRNEHGVMSPWINIPSIFDGPIIDSSGAGDWLTAGFLSELIICKGDLSLEKLKNAREITNMLNKGMKYSKLCCASIGAQGFFYEPYCSREFSRLTTGKYRLENLQMPKSLVVDKKQCPMCLSEIPQKTAIAVH